MPGVATQVKVVFSAETASYTASVKAAKQQLGVFENSAKTAGSTARKEMTEARGAVAVLGEEIGIHLPRHVQKFVAGLPGVASAMSAAFSAVAVIAIASAVFEAGKKVYEFAEKNEEAGRKFRESWEASGRSLDQSLTELELSNVKMANHIALLEHKPENKLLEALLETRLETERLDEKLQNVMKDAKSALEQAAPGFMSRAFLGTTATAQEQSMISEHSRWLNLAQNPEGMLQESKSFGAALERRLAELEKKQAAADKMRATASSGPNTPAAPGAVIAPNFQAEIESVKSLMQRQKWEQAYVSGMITDSAERKDTVRVDAAFAASRAAAKEALAKAMRAVEGRVKELVGRPVKVPESGREAQRMEDQPVPDSLSSIALQADEDMSPIHYGERWRGFNEAVMQGFEAQARFRAELALTKLGLDESTGAVSRHEAAIRRLGIEDADYKSQAAYIGGRMQQVRGDTTLTAPQQAQQLQQLQNQLDRIAADQKIRDVVGRNEINSTSPLGELRNRAAELAQEFTNLGDHLSNFTTRTLESFNETLLRTLSTPASFLRGQHPWRNLGSSVAQTAGSSALQFAEGSIMKSIPGLEKLIHKPSGTQSDPLYVAMAAGKIASSVASGSSLLGKAVQVGIGLLPHFAEGGMMPSNMPALVGENGPELFMPRTSGQIIPNGEFGGGGGTVHNWNINAQGANDPAATEAAVRRGILQSIPLYQNITRSTMRDDRVRTTSRNRI